MQISEMAESTSNVKVTPRFFLQFPWAPKAKDICDTLQLSKICLLKKETFFVSFKNCCKLLFITSNLEQLGMKANSVTFSSKEILNFIYDRYGGFNHPFEFGVPFTQHMKNISPSKEEHSEMEIFSFDDFKGHGVYGYLLEEYARDSLENNEPSKLDELFSTFTFQVYITASQENYQFQLGDLLLKNHLWTASVDRQGTDVEIHVQGKSLFAHKAILAGRSEVFKNQFTADNTVHHLTIEDCDLAAFEEFLYFIYTGELMRTAASPPLLILAKVYRIETLETLCRAALDPLNEKISGRQALDFHAELAPLNGVSSKFELMY